MFDTRIKTFLNVCQTLNYTQSARELNITQPAVSQHIAFLEKEYGVKLFNYQNRHLSLTRAGEILRDAAQLFTHNEDLLRRKLEQLQGGERHLTIGATLTAGEYLIADPLAHYLKSEPTLNIRFVSGDTTDLLEQIQHGQIDCALIEGFIDKSAFDWRILKKESFICIAGPNTPFERCHLEDVLDQHLLIREKGSGTRAVLEHKLREKNLSLSSFSRVSEITSINVIKRLVANDYGISFLYESAAHKELESGELKTITLAEKPVTHDITFVWLKGSHYTEEIDRLIDGLQSTQLGDASLDNNR